jgi:hypothetical protein
MTTTRPKVPKIAGARAFLELRHGESLERSWVDAIVDRRDDPASWPDDLKDYVISRESHCRGPLVPIAQFLRTHGPA